MCLPNYSMRFCSITVLFLSFCVMATLTGCTAFPLKTQQVWRSFTDHDYPCEPTGSAAFEAALDKYTESVALPLHDGRLLQNGDEYYPAILRLIEQASETICLETYIVERDATTDRVFNALIDAASRGVRVRILVDAAGFHRGLIAQLDELTDRNIEARVFNPFFLSWTLVRGNNRDHRKIFVADGKHAILGGINLSDEQAGDGVAGWRDTAMQISGPGALAAARAFEQTWQQGGRGWIGKDVPIAFLNPAKRGIDSALFGDEPDRVGQLPDEPGGPRDGQGTVRVVVSSPGAANSPTYDLAILGILGARERIDIASAYFVPPLNLRRALLAAAERGVRVRLLLPGVTDVKGVREMGMRFYGEFLEAGIEIYEWPYAILHSKTMAVDGKWLVVGSANMDSRSYFLNYEANLAVSDAKLAEELHAQFDKDLTQAQQTSLEKWRKRPARQKQFEWLSIPASGQY